MKLISTNTALKSNLLRLIGEGVVAKLQAGAKVADVGCGHGASTLVMAQAFPASTFVGYDYHGPSITTANARAREAGLAERVSF